MNGNHGIHHMSYTVVHNLLFTVVCVSFCLPVAMCNVLHVSSSNVVLLGVGDEIQAASLRYVQQEGLL